MICVSSSLSSSSSSVQTRKRTPSRHLRPELCFDEAIELFKGQAAVIAGKSDRARLLVETARLYFFPLPQGQGSLRPILSIPLCLVRQISSDSKETLWRLQYRRTLLIEGRSLEVLDIQKLASGDPWADSWSERGWIPDYSHVREQLESLLANGQS